MIRIGTAGVPLYCKGRGNSEGVRCVKSLGLDAMEVEFVRGVRMNPNDAEIIRKFSQSENVLISVHAPYFINLASKEKEKVEASKQRLLVSARYAKMMGAKIVVFHPGFYMGREASVVYEIIKNEVMDVREKLNLENNRVILGLETTGRQKQFGTLAENIKIAAEVDGVLPVVDFAHLHARGSGCLKERNDFEKIFEEIEKSLGKAYMHCHFSGVYYKKGNERYHIPIESREPDYALLADILRENYNDRDITLICESPLLEMDALRLKEMIFG